MMSALPDKQFFKIGEAAELIAAGGAYAWYASRGNDVEVHIEGLRPAVEAGFEEVYVANMGPHYADMIANGYHRMAPCPFQTQGIMLNPDGGMFFCENSDVVGNVLAAVLTAYFVGTALTTVRPVSSLTRRVDAVAIGVVARGFQSLRIDIGAHRLRRAEQQGGDGEDAGAAAEVEHGLAAQVLAGEPFQAQRRRRVRAGAEGQAGVEPDHVPGLGRRFVPARHDP